MRREKISKPLPVSKVGLAKAAKGRAGFRPTEPLKWLKRSVVQRYYNLSDGPPEFSFCDRLSFQKFLRWTVADKVPDANPLRPLAMRIHYQELTPGG